MATIVTPLAYDNPCAEIWVDPCNLSNPDMDLAEQAAISATYALWSLTGERFHGPQCWIEDYRTINGFCTIQLRQWPVAEVLAVSRIDLCADAVGATGVGSLISSACHMGGGQVRVCGSSNSFGVCGCGADGSIIRVHYKTSNNLPPGADRAVLRLADEYLKSYKGEKCSLPERVTSVSRQGASWTILDPQDFLQDGLTGIGPIDQWLAIVGLRSRWAQLVDPLKSVPLVSSTLYGCGEDDCFADI
jgi:hypothetical protein